MPPEEILLVNPNTGTTPVFRSRRDAEITIGIYRRVPILRLREPEVNPWRVTFLRMFDITNDSGFFSKREDLQATGWNPNGNIFTKGSSRMLPLYEAKMAYQFDHRFGTYSGQTQSQANMGTLPRLTPQQKDDPDFVISPLYWVSEGQVLHRLARRSFSCKSALLGHRRVARSTDERSCIATLVPWGAVSYGLILSTGPTASELTLLAASFNSFIYDYLLRNSFSQASIPQATLEQVPVPPPSAFQDSPIWAGGSTVGHWVEQRVLELSYVAYDMTSFAQELGDDEPPFRWNEKRRSAIRAELDAAYFHLYSLERGEVEHVMESFDALRRREEKPQNFGEFRTKRLILERYDVMAEATRLGEPYQTVLDPPPGHGLRHPPH